MGYSDIPIILGMLICGYMGFKRVAFDTSFGAAFAGSVIQVGTTVVSGAKQDPAQYYPIMVIGALWLLSLLLFVTCWWVASKLPNQKAD